MSESLMKYNLHQLLVKAMMQKIPLIVVEGADDRPFYLRIAEAEGKRVQVIPSELVKKTDGYYYAPGCEGVIEIVEHVQGDIQRNPVCKKYFLGIIDGDYREYTEEDLGLECLFKLKYYSYESHFITENAVRNLIAYTTRVGMQDIGEEIIADIWNAAKPVMDGMYLVGLEILNERMEPLREKLFAEDTKPETLYQVKDGNSLMDMVLDKEQELNRFAEYMGIKRDDIRCVVKGKYLLYAFVKAVYEEIGKLNGRCRSGQMEQCDYCKNEKFHLCIWKVKNQIKRSEYNNVMIDVSWKTESEIEYIKNRLSVLG